MRNSPLHWHNDPLRTAVGGERLPCVNAGGGVASGKFVAWVPKSLHAQLATRAKAEGVSLDALVLAFLAGGLGRRESHGG